MILVVLNIEFIKNNRVKELGVYKDWKTVMFLFLTHKNFKSTTQPIWSTEQFYGISCSRGYKKYTELENILRSLVTSETEFFAKH